jgi:hypothetical protein
MLVENLKERDHSDDPCVDERIISEINLNENCGRI